MGRPAERYVDSRGQVETGQGPVHRAFAVLQLVVAASGPVGVRELERRSGLSRSSVSRHLGILADLGMVSRRSNGQAVPGPALDTLVGGESSNNELLGHQLRPLLVELCDVFGENSALGVDQVESFFYLAGERQTGAVQVPDPTNTTYPLHLLASGVLMMAHWDQARVNSYLAGELDAATSYSVVDPDRIRLRLDQVRSDGFCWAQEELDLEVNGLAVPVWGRGKECVAAVSLYGPSYRLNPADRPGLATQLAELVVTRTVGLSL